VKTSRGAGGGITGDQNTLNADEVGVGERTNHRAVQRDGDLGAVLLQYHVVVLPGHSGGTGDLDPAGPATVDGIGMRQWAAGPAVDLKISVAFGAGDIDVHVEAVVRQEVEGQFVLARNGSRDTASHPVGGLCPGDENLLIHNQALDRPIRLGRPAVAHEAVGPVEVVLEGRPPNVGRQKQTDKHSETSDLIHRISPSRK